MEPPTRFILRRLSEECREDLVAEYKAHNKQYQLYIIEKRKLRSKQLAARYAEMDAKRKAEQEEEICKVCSLPISKCDVSGQMPPPTAIQKGVASERYLFQIERTQRAIHGCHTETHL